MSTTRYKALADDLGRRIRDGIFKPGSQLPSVRELCSLHQASPATVTHALYLLEDAGLIEARPRSGFFVRAPRNRLPAPERCAEPGLPQAIALTEHRELTMALLRGDKDGWLGRAVIDPHFYPLHALQKLMSKLARHEPELLAHVAMNAGEAELREQLARRSIKLGCDFRPEEIVITHGDKEAVAICLRLLTQPGDIVAVTAPGDLALLELLKSLGLRALEIPAHPTAGLSVEALAEALARERIAACLFTANFPMPTSSLMSDEAKQRTVALLAEKGVPLIEEDSFGELYHGERRPLPLKAFDQHDNVLYCADLSFSIAPGLPCGFAVTGRWRLRFESERFAGFEPVSPLVQRTLASWLKSGQFEPALRKLRHALADNVARYRSLIAECFPAGTRIADAPGGLLIWVELPGEVDTVALLHRALAENIRFAPGRLFSLNNSFHNCLRINGGYRLSPEIEAHLRRLGALASLSKSENTPRSESI